MSKVMIQTDRLIIKDLKPEHAGTVFHYRSNADISKYQSFAPKNINDVIRFIEENTKMFNIQDNWFQAGIFRDGELIGDIGIHFIGPDNNQCEIGYTISKDFQKQGFGKEAVIGIIDYLFTMLHKHRIVASLNPDNKASMALLKSIGFRKEATYIKSIYNNGEWQDDVWFGILEEEWVEKKCS